MPCGAYESIQRDGGLVIVQGETWTRKITIAEREFESGDAVIVKMISATGTTVYNESFSTIEDDGSIIIAISATETAALLIGRYIIRFFVSIDSVPYLIDGVPSRVYVTR